MDSFTTLANSFLEHSLSTMYDRVNILGYETLKSQKEHLATISKFHKLLAYV